MSGRSLSLATLATVAVGALQATAVALADDDALPPGDQRFNDSVVANVYTLQRQLGCENDVRVNPLLQRAAQWHARDLHVNRNLDGNVGSDGSTPQDRADAAGFQGVVAETVAVHPANEISGIDLINRWYNNPADLAIMSDCANNEIGVWSENSVDRTVVVAVYGQVEEPVDTPHTPIGPAPDYDGSDELEYAISWLPWILRGVYPPPSHPPQ
ncbi:CAP domain-containing protein [Mycobacterium sp. 1274756.6]|uniref:CAP domain-containing protein n=1 Tax=Mycobacterium sp. 1274756.6 TaxID=1834076 RepID=UPI0009ED9B01|nr:CAP domain-containing protein [Mycobacterium sp. 1274756.6]